MRFIHARLTLAIAVILNLYRRFFGTPMAPEAWVRRINAESIGPTPQEAWLLLAGSSACVGCGLCDAVVPSDVQASMWLQHAVRTPMDAPLALEKAALLRQHHKAIEAICPVHIVVEDTARLIEAHARVLRENPLQK